LNLPAKFDFDRIDDFKFKAVLFYCFGSGKSFRVGQLIYFRPKKFSLKRLRSTSWFFIAYEIDPRYYNYVAVRHRPQPLLVFIHVWMVSCLHPLNALKEE